MTADEHFATRRVVRFGTTGAEVIEDRVASEAPMEIRIGSTPIAVLMRTPGDDVDLTLGFALTEGIAIHPHELVGAVSVGSEDEDARYRLEFADGVEVNPDQFKRNRYASSSCGVCGKASIDAVRIAACATVARPPDRWCLPRLVRGDDASRPTRLRRHRGTPRRRPVPAGRNNGRAARGHRPPQRSRQGGRCYIRNTVAAERPPPVGIRQGVVRNRPEGCGGRDPDGCRHLSGLSLAIDLAGSWG